MSLVAGLRFIEVLHRSVLLGLERQVLANLAGASLSIARAVGALVILAFVSPTLAAFFWWQLAISVVSVVVLVWSAYAALPRGIRAGRPSMESVRQVRGYAARMSIGALLGFGLTQVDKVILSRTLSLEEYGLFVVASTAAGGVTMLVGPLTQAYFPRLCQLHAASDGVDFARVFHVGSQLTTVVVGTAGLVLAARSEMLLFAWTGSHEIAQGISTVTSLLALANTLNAVTWILYQAQLAHGWLRFGLVCNSIAVCAVVPAMIVSALNYGAVGAAMVWLALNVAFVTIAPPIVFRRIMVGHYWAWLWGDVVAPLGAAALVLWLTGLLPIPSEPHRFAGFLRCVLEGIVALACAAIATPGLRGVLRDGFRRFGPRRG
jgi:O-antigen/teichoic acid export membrane protein